MKRYTPIHFTAGTEFEVWFDTLGPGYTQSILCSFVKVNELYLLLYWSNSVRHVLHGEKLLEILFPIHITMETDVEVNFSQVMSIPTLVGVFATVVELVEYYKNVSGVNLQRRKMRY